MSPTTANIHERCQLPGLAGEVANVQHRAWILTAVHDVAERFLDTAVRRGEYHVLWVSAGCFRLFVVNDRFGLDELLPPSNPLKLGPITGDDDDRSSADTALAQRWLGNFSPSEGGFIELEPGADDTHLIRYLIELTGRAGHFGVTRNPINDRPPGARIAAGITLMVDP